MFFYNIIINMAKIIYITKHFYIFILCFFIPLQKLFFTVYYYYLIKYLGLFFMYATIFLKYYCNQNVSHTKMKQFAIIIKNVMPFK